MGPRKLLKEGVLAKQKSGRKLRLFLCNDILVLTDVDVKQLYKMVIVLDCLETSANRLQQPMQLSEIEVKNTSGARGRVLFICSSRNFLISFFSFLQMTLLFS